MIMYTVHSIIVYKLFVKKQSFIVMFIMIMIIIIRSIFSLSQAFFFNTEF